MSWLSGQYRWLSHAKLLDLEPQEPGNNGPPNIPESLDEVLDVMAAELAALRAKSPEVPLGIVWHTPIWDPSGYADEGRAFAKALASGDRELSLSEIPWSDKRCQLDQGDAVLLRALACAKRPRSCATITNCIPTLACPDAQASLNILRTTFETDRIPPAWLPHLEFFDEIWVISRHNLESFRRSWVPPEKLRVVPSCIDTALYRPDGPKLKLPEKLVGRFVFLSVFDWQLRKGWDVLLCAYTQEFSAGEGIGLLLKISRAHGHSLEVVQRQAEAVLAETGHTLADRPDIVLWDETLEAPQMAALYRTAGAFVLASRGEGWGRPYMEAMASELPTIGTAASGNLDFMTVENSYLIPARMVDVPDAAAREISVYRGHRWYEPDIDELRKIMRQVAADRQGRWRCAKRAAREIRERFGLPAGRQTIEQALSAAEERFVHTSPMPPNASQLRVALEGDFFAENLCSKLNERLALEINQHAALALSLRTADPQPTSDKKHNLRTQQLQPYFGREFAEGVQVTIRHAQTPNWQRPPQGRWVHLQPSALEHLPPEGSHALQNEVDEIWVPSHIVRSALEGCGIAARKIQVVPGGINAEVFNPDAPPLILPTHKSFKFICVVSNPDDEGVDNVVEAYANEFGPDEDVCLVVKDLDWRMKDRDDRFRDQLLQAASDPKNPSIIHIQRQLTDGQFASLYTACQCLVTACRGTNFDSSILEAMACGVAPMIPGTGSVEDLVTNETGILMASNLADLGESKVSDESLQQLRVRVPELRQSMRRAFQERDRLGPQGQAARQMILEKHTLARTVDWMTNRLHVITRSDQSENLDLVRPASAELRDVHAPCVAGIPLWISYRAE